MSNFGIAHACTVVDFPKSQEQILHLADSVKALKRAYSLRRAVPKALLREMTTDRPDVTESAYSVDAGHFQLETELAGYWDVRQSGWQATLNGGPILRLGDTIQFDVGVNLALTRNTPSSYFIGFSFRH